MLAIKENSIRIDDQVTNFGGISCTLSDGTTASALYMKMFANKYVFYFEEDFVINHPRQYVIDLKILFTKYLNANRIFDKSGKVKVESISS